MLENRFVGPQMRAGEWRRRNHIFELAWIGGCFGDATRCAQSPHSTPFIGSCYTVIDELLLPLSLTQRALPGDQPNYLKRRKKLGPIDSVAKLLSVRTRFGR